MSVWAFYAFVGLGFRVILIGVSLLVEATLALAFQALMRLKSVCKSRGAMRDPCHAQAITCQPEVSRATTTEKFHQVSAFVHGLLLHYSA